MAIDLGSETKEILTAHREIRSVRTAEREFVKTLVGCLERRDIEEMGPIDGPYTKAEYGIAVRSMRAMLGYLRETGIVDLDVADINEATHRIPDTDLKRLP